MKILSFSQLRILYCLLILMELRVWQCTPHNISTNPSQCVSITHTHTHTHTILRQYSEMTGTAVHYMLCSSRGDRAPIVLKLRQWMETINTTPRPLFPLLQFTIPVRAVRTVFTFAIVQQLQLVCPFGLWRGLSTASDIFYSVLL